MENCAKIMHQIAQIFRATAKTTISHTPYAVV